MVILSIFASQVFMLVLNCLPCCFLPRLPIFFGSVISADSPLAIRLLIIFYHCYICVPMYSTLSVESSAVFAYAALVVPFLANELALGRKSYKSLSKLRVVDTLVLEYRTAQLMQYIFNAFVGPLLIPLQTLITLMFMVAGFLVIRNWNTMNTISLMLMIAWAFIAPFCWILGLIMASYLFRNGNKILNSWKYHQMSIASAKERKLLGKVRVSCKPLCVAYKKVYVVRPISSMVFTRGLVKGLMRTLLTLKTN